MAGCLVVIITALGAVASTAVRPRSRDALPAASPDVASPLRQPRRTPAIRLDPAVLDFGVLRPGRAVDGTIRIVNDSRASIRIDQIKPSCGCTVVDLATETIGPGDSVAATVRFHPRGQPGKRATRSIRFVLAGTAEPLTLVVQGSVAAPDDGARGRGLAPPQAPSATVTAHRDSDFGGLAGRHRPLLDFGAARPGHVARRSLVLPWRFAAKGETPEVACSSTDVSISVFDSTAFDEGLLLILELVASGDATGELRSACTVTLGRQETVVDVRAQLQRDADPQTGPKDHPSASSR